MRIIGLDYGEKYIGVAVSDGKESVASGVSAIKNSGITAVLIELGNILEEYQAKKVVIGLPVNLSGEEGFQAKIVKDFAKVLKHKFDIETVFMDERFTSSIGEKGLIRKKVMPGEKDIKSAQIILQTYLDGEK